MWEFMTVSGARRIEHPSERWKPEGLVTFCQYTEIIQYRGQSRNRSHTQSSANSGGV